MTHKFTPGGRYYTFSGNAVVACAECGHGEAYHFKGECSSCNLGEAPARVSWTSTRSVLDEPDRTTMCPRCGNKTMIISRGKHGSCRFCGATEEYG